MSTFKYYAEYYNLLYANKDYAEETNFIDKIIKKNAPSAKTILNIGCGTGNHDFLLAKLGYCITGVDLSEDMLKVANQNRNGKKNSIDNPFFIKGDIRDIKLDKQFDVITALFHVVSYLPTNQDVSRAFKTVKEHLKPGGIFIFDVWYGPAVLACKPEVRFKRMENEKISVSRVAEPVIYPEANIVDVNYTVFVKEKSTASYEEFKETHKMRYFFTPELNNFLTEKKMSVLFSGEWMSDNTPGLDTWGVYFVAKNE